MIYLVLSLVVGIAYITVTVEVAATYNIEDNVPVGMAFGMAAFWPIQVGKTLYRGFKKVIAS